MVRALLLRPLPLAAFGACAYLWLRHQRFESLQRALGVGATPLHDFAAFFHPMGAKVLTDPTPLEGFLYPPFAALLFVPLGALSYSTAAFLWSALLVGCTVGIALLWSALIDDLTPLRRWLGVLLTLLAYPIWHNFKFGQVSTILIFGALLSLYAYQRDRPHLSALLLSVVIAVKLYLGVLALLYVFRRDRRALGALALGCAVWLFVLPVSLFGPDETLRFYENVAGQLNERFGQGIHDANSQGIQAVMRRFGLRSVALPVQILSVAGLALWASRLVRGTRHEVVQGFVVLLGMTPFVAPTSWPHYFVYLPFCQVVVWALLHTKRDGAHFRAAHALNALSALLISMPFFDFVADRVLFVRAGLPFIADLTMLFALFLARGAEARAQERVSPTQERSHSPLLAAFTLACLIATLGRFTLAPYDDAYFFKRFALSFLDHGVFAWNTSDGPVYGNTSQAFQLLTAAITALFRDHTIAITRLVMAVSLVFAGWVCAHACRSREGQPAVYVAFLSPMALATIFSGMETPLALLIGALFLLCAERSWSEVKRSLVLGALVAASYLVRPDLSLLLGTALLCEWRDAGLQFRSLLRAGAVAAVLIGATLFACSAYYGSALPLAFYLKSGQSNLYDSHFLALGALSKREHLLHLAVSVLPLLVLAWRIRDRAQARLMVPPLVFLAYHGFFTVEVMGMHSRFYAPLLPWIALAAARGLARAPSQQARELRWEVGALLAIAAITAGLYAAKLIPTTRGWPLGRVEPLVYASYLVAALLLVALRHVESQRRGAWALCTIASGLAVAHPAQGFAFPSDAQYVARNIEHVSGYRGMETLIDCFGRGIHAYHSEIGVIGMELSEGAVTDLGGIMEPELARGRARFDTMCARDKPEAIFLPHKNYRALNAEILAGQCIQDYRLVVKKSSSPLYIRSDLHSRFIECAQKSGDPFVIFP